MDLDRIMLSTFFFARTQNKHILRQYSQHCFPLPRAINIIRHFSTHLYKHEHEWANRIDKVQDDLLLVRQRKRLQLARIKIVFSVAVIRVAYHYSELDTIILS